MNKSKTKTISIALLAVVMLVTLCLGLFLNTAAAAPAEAYRNQLAFSPELGWNNDPNGLLYANGTYHMYYQYNYNQHASGSKTDTVWGHMSWGHATSTDLVHWTEQPVAIPAYQGEYQNGVYEYEMMFSGSAVYDEYNTSGLFETDSDGKVVDGQGIVAFLTQPQPKLNADGTPVLNEFGDKITVQRQILAYSKDYGQSFEIKGEIIGADRDGNFGDGEFRDPKVYWNDTANRWLMVVGGGVVRMYASDDLLTWDYLGDTGYWGECPDMLRFEVDGEEKYVLVISPEDRKESHEWNYTNPTDTYYPAEYYVVGDIYNDGFFYSYEPIQRLSEGIDSYAFQSFNNVPNGKVYGVSWSANPKTVAEYRDFRSNYNGGMTVVCELNLIEQDGQYVLTRSPIDAYADLRSSTLKEFDGELTAGVNALADVSANVADITVEVDFTDSMAKNVELCLRVSDAEKIVIKYNASRELLTLDRANSSVLAKDTFLYQASYSKEVPLVDGKLSLRVLLDKAFVSLFANDGYASFFTAVFPAAGSNKMSLTADGDVNVKAKVYAMNGIYQNEVADELIVSTYKIDTTVGKVNVISATSYSTNFDASQVKFEITDGADVVTITQAGEFAQVTALKAGSAHISVSYRGQKLEKQIEIYAYDNGLVSQVEYPHSVGGFSLIREDGLFFAGEGDAFLFSNTKATNIIYSAEFTPVKDGSQAGALVFGGNDSLTNYYVATADTKDGLVKLWKSGVGDLVQAVPYNFAQGAKFTLTVVVSNGMVNIFVNGNSKLTYQLDEYQGGRVGLNIYNAEMAINNVTLTDINVSSSAYYFGGVEITKVYNDDEGEMLTVGHYSYKNGLLTFSDAYLRTLEANADYTFVVTTATLGDIYVSVTTNFTSCVIATVRNTYYKQDGLKLTVSGSAVVSKLTIDGKEVAFTQSGNEVMVAASVLEKLSDGTHTVKAFTDKGRPTVVFTLKDKVKVGNDSIEPDPEPVSHTFLYIDIAIFATLILAYVAFNVVKKYKNS